MSEKLVERLEAFADHRPGSLVQMRMTELRRAFRTLVTHLDSAMPESRQKSLAITALEESAMWAKKALSVTDTEGVVVDPPEEPEGAPLCP